MAETLPAAGFNLAWAWLLLLLPLPWLLRRWLSAATRAGVQALRVPWFGQVAESSGGWMRQPLLAAIAGLVWVLLLLAAARPQWVGEIETLPVTGRDLLRRALSDAVSWASDSPERSSFLPSVITTRMFCWSERQSWVICR